MDNVKKLNKSEFRDIYNKISDEEKEYIASKANDLEKILPIFLIAKNKKDLNSIGLFGSMSQNYCKKYNCSYFYFLKELKVFEEVVMDKIENIKNIKKKKKAKKKFKKKSENIKTLQNKQEPAPYTLGDLIRDQGIKLK